MTFVDCPTNSRMAGNLSGGRAARAPDGGRGPAVCGFRYGAMAAYEVPSWAWLSQATAWPVSLAPDR